MLILQGSGKSAGTQMFPSSREISADGGEWRCALSLISLGFRDTLHLPRDSQQLAWHPGNVVMNKNCGVCLWIWGFCVCVFVCVCFCCCVCLWLVGLFFFFSEIIHLNVAVLNLFCNRLFALSFPFLKLVIILFPLPFQLCFLYAWREWYQHLHKCGGGIATFWGTKL